jgi:hypothetical protein
MKNGPNFEKRNELAFEATYLGTQVFTGIMFVNLISFLFTAMDPVGSLGLP